jgi:hypothetical protein
MARLKDLCGNQGRRIGQSDVAMLTSLHVIRDRMLETANYGRHSNEVRAVACRNAEVIAWAINKIEADL